MHGQLVAEVVRPFGRLDRVDVADHVGYGDVRRGLEDSRTVLEKNNQVTLLRHAHEVNTSVARNNFEFKHIAGLELEIMLLTDGFRLKENVGIRNSVWEDASRLPYRAGNLLLRSIQERARSGACGLLWRCRNRATEQSLRGSRDELSRRGGR